MNSRFSGVDVVAAVVLGAFSPHSFAQTPLTCAQNDVTFALMCFPTDGVRVNGDVRGTKLYQGGPNEIKATPYTVRVHCVSGALELTDKQGVAFARNVPEAQVGQDFVLKLCGHPKVKNDPKLSTK